MPNQWDQFTYSKMLSKTAKILKLTKDQIGHTARTETVSWSIKLLLKCCDFPRRVYLSSATFDHLSQSYATLRRFTRFDGLSQTLEVLPTLSRSARKLENISRAAFGSLAVLCTYRLCAQGMSLLYNCFRVAKAAGILRNINQCEMMDRKPNSKLKPKRVKVNGYTDGPSGGRVIMVENKIEHNHRAARRKH